LNFTAVNTSNLTHQLVAFWCCVMYIHYTHPSIYSIYLSSYTDQSHDAKCNMQLKALRLGSSSLTTSSSIKQMCNEITVKYT